MPGSTGLLARPLILMMALAGALFIAMTWGDKPTFWPGLISAYFIAAAVLVFQARKSEDKKSIAGELFSKNVWLHPSTIQDIAMTFITFVLMTQVLYLIVLDPNFIILGVAKLLSLLPLSHAADAKPSLGIIALYVVLSMMASDFLYYISHWLTHKIPVLWEFHKVHHSGKTLTPLTVYRIHFLDAWWNQCFRNVGTGIVAGIFFYFYPSELSVFVIAGNLTGTYILHFVAANIRHSHIWISFGPVLERIFISPAQHQIHHSDNPKHFDKNYGSFFALWDWIFGSLYIPKERETLSFGLGNNRHNNEIHSSLWKMNIYPLINFAKWLRG